jgi:hypothetical protein
LVGVLVALAPVMVMLMAGCGRTPVWIRGSDTFADTEVIDGPGATSTSGGDTQTWDCDPVTGLCPLELVMSRAVDILFVVDNSGSMGSKQGTLARSFASFIEVLESQELGANYRIGITTTDGSGTLRATSCRSRLHEFQFSWIHGDKDERQRGCLDHCGHETLTFAKPWLEKGAGTTNLPPGLDMAEALQCVGPQGINGPGLEKPLESMLRALEDDASGFFRDEALLAVIIVTDEADCSMTSEMEQWISTEGTVYWGTPERPTSAVCWNAGVGCEGAPSPFSQCYAQDKGANGLPTADPEEARLLPVARYIDALSQLAQKKQMTGHHGQVLFSLIGGVPVDFPDTPIVYADSALAEFQAEYGIGPSCGIGTESITNPPGIPPVRMREVAEAFMNDETNMFSICMDDYGVALEQIAGAIEVLAERACVTGCVADLDHAAPALVPSCILTERFLPESNQADRDVLPCDITDDGWDFPAEDVHACYRILTDPGGQTPDPSDDMSSQCATLGFNLELWVERREDIPVPAGTAVHVVCDLLGPPGVHCEDL